MLAVAVGEVGVVLRHGGIDVAIFGHELGAEGFFAEVNVAGSYGVGGLNDFPLCDARRTWSVELARRIAIRSGEVPRECGGNRDGGHVLGRVGRSRWKMFRGQRDRK